MAVLLLATLPAAAQETPGPAVPCSAAAYRRFDFWAGDWVVLLPDGSKAGENQIVVVSGGCALFESWSGQKGGHGNSLNYYSRDDGRWHQIWVDGGGGRLELSGGLAGEAMVLEGTKSHATKTGVRQTQRITWTPHADGSVRQHWQTSEDTGTSWETVFDGRYVRKAPAPAKP